MQKNDIIKNLAIEEINNLGFGVGHLVDSNGKRGQVVFVQDTVTGDNVRLSYVVTDKNVVIRDGRELCGCESMPFYIGKQIMV